MKLKRKLGIWLEKKLMLSNNLKTIYILSMKNLIKKKKSMTFTW